MTSALPRVLLMIALALPGERRAGRGTRCRRSAMRPGCSRPTPSLRAEQQIDDIRRTYDRNLFVDTVKSASPHERKLFRFLWTRQVNRILEEQARKCASESGVDGIYVVICNDPKDVHVVVRPADDAAFTRHDARSCGGRSHGACRTAAPMRPCSPWSIRSVPRSKPMPRAVSPRSVVNEFVLASLLGGGVALWLVLCGVRFKMRASQAGNSLDDSAAERARRTPALLGAMFGFPAGQWIYDKLYPSTPQAAGVSRMEPDGLAALEGDAETKAEVESPPVKESPEDAPVSP